MAMSSRHNKKEISCVLGLKSVWFNLWGENAKESRNVMWSSLRVFVSGFVIFIIIVHVKMDPKRTIKLTVGMWIIMLAVDSISQCIRISDFKLPNICIGLKNPKSVGLYVGERLTPKLQTISMKLINLKKLVAQLLLVKQSGLVQG